MQTSRYPPSSLYHNGLDRGGANYAPLTPLSFLERSADVYPERIAVVHGDWRCSYGELRRRCRRLASALTGLGVAPGDTVAMMAPNIPAMIEAHYGVAMAGAVLNALNIRLDPAAIAFILSHGEAKLLLVDGEFTSVVERALAMLERRPIVIDITISDSPAAARLGQTDYETLLDQGDAEFAPLYPHDEWQAITLNYTSGTTGNPKGVVYHHRGAYLNAVGNSLVWQMPHHPVYLWTLPMFHCNGWCFPWTVVLQAGTQICLRRLDGPSILGAIVEHGVTHLCGAPIVMAMMANVPEALRPTLPGRVRMMTAASAPPPSVLERMGGMGIEVTHVYGLTEVYGPATVCAWQEAWNDLPPRDRAEKLARQGVRYPVLEGLTVLDPETRAPVPRDGRTLGEIAMRGNIAMMGYLKNPSATQEAFNGGWFHTGDLAVMHGDGYLEIRDRAKDLIISGGENISTIEIETALYRHPDVLEAAVVAAPDERWGETPCAFVLLRDGATADAGELSRHCRAELAAFKVPRHFVFGPLPKTSTGKVQKFALREHARQLSLPPR